MYVLVGLFTPGGSMARWLDCTKAFKTKERKDEKPRTSKVVC